MTLKQTLHNWIFGENSRQQNIQEHYLFASAVSPGLQMPDPNRVWGIDISHWDGLVNLSVTRDRGGEFVFIKGLDGTVRSKYFADNRSRAMTVGMLQAPYFWLYPDAKVSCKAQALEATKLLKEYPSDLPAMLDFEWTRYAGLPANPNYSDLDKWATEYLAQGNRKPFLYTAAGYINQFGKMPDALKNKFAGIAIANYDVINPTLPYGYGAWDFWQFTASGDAAKLAPGELGKRELDLDYWHSDVDALYRFAGIYPEIIGDAMYQGKTNQNPTKIFDKVGGSQIDQLPVGTTVTGYAPASGYAQITAPKQGYVKLLHLTGYTAIIPTPPPPPPDPEPVPTELPVLSISLRAEGYPDVNIQWQPL